MPNPISVYDFSKYISSSDVEMIEYINASKNFELTQMAIAGDLVTLYKHGARIQNERIVQVFKDLELMYNLKLDIKKGYFMQDMDKLSDEFYSLYHLIKENHLERLVFFQRLYDAIKRSVGVFTIALKTEERNYMIHLILEAQKFRTICIRCLCLGLLSLQDSECVSSLLEIENLSRVSGFTKKMPSNAEIMELFMITNSFWIIEHLLIA